MKNYIKDIFNSLYKKETFEKSNKGKVTKYEAEDIYKYYIKRLDNILKIGDETMYKYTYQKETTYKDTIDIVQRLSSIYGNLKLKDVITREQYLEIFKKICSGLR